MRTAIFFRLALGASVAAVGAFGCSRAHGPATSDPPAIADVSRTKPFEPTLHGRGPAPVRTVDPNVERPAEHGDPARDAGSPHP